MAIERLMFGFRMFEARHMSDTGEDKPKCGNSQLLIVLAFLHFDSRLDFASPKQPLWEGRLSHKVSPLMHLSFTDAGSLSPRPWNQKGAYQPRVHITHEL